MKTMKNTITKIAIGLFALVIIELISCTGKQPTQDEIVMKNAEEYVKSKMNDPESYEFVKIELIDSVLFKDNIQLQRGYFSQDIDKDRRLLEIKERYKTDEQEVQDLKAEIEKNEKILFKIDSLESELGDRKNEVASYDYIFSFRGNNALGAKILNEYVLQTGPAPDFKVIDMNDEGIKHRYPNHFPGYEVIYK